MQTEELISKYPTLYHMAEEGSWQSIKTNGLLSTSKLLDLYSISGEERLEIESAHRPESIGISKEGLPDAVVRDQKPMSDSALRKVLLDGLTPQDWYEKLNSKVFFWSSEAKVHKLLNARAYRDKSHDVLSVDTEKLIKLYEKKMVLCPYNSGSTIMNPVQRGNDLFKSVSDYDFEFWRKKRGKQGAVTEVCVEGGVIDILKVVIMVKRMKQENVQRVLY